MTEQLRGPFEKFVDSPYYSVFEKWVERCKKCVASQGRSLHIHEVPTQSNKMSPRIFQTDLVQLTIQLKLHDYLFISEL